MLRKVGLGLGFSLIALCLGSMVAWYVGGSQPGPVVTDPADKTESTGNEKSLEGTSPASPDLLQHRFATQVQPLLKRYCFSCHGAKKQEASLDLSRDATAAAVAGNVQQWETVLERLQSNEMPPEEATHQPKPGERAAMIQWIANLREHEAGRKADDPGSVLAHRLSNAEFDYTIRDLTGVDIRPTREFPVDPANEAGFDNSGESLTMSPALMKKYLAAARLVADHLVLKPEGFVFAPHPVVAETDRDKYCVARIIDFYRRHQVDFADYFLAAWKYHHRAQLGHPEKPLSQWAGDAGLSANYLSMVWSLLTSTEAESGPPAVVRQLWRELPSPQGKSPEGARAACERMRDVVLRMRRQFDRKAVKLSVKAISPGSQAVVLWNNRQEAGRHRSYSGEVLPDIRKLAKDLQGQNATGAKMLEGDAAGPAAEKRLRGAVERFCALFPRAFVVSDRGAYFNANGAGQGRPLTAGFHLMQGYFRDDAPLCELILDARGRRELDGLWHELNFITLAPMRQFKDFIFFERAESPRFLREAEFDFARSEDRDATSEAKMTRLALAYLAKARRLGAGPEGQKAIETYFAGIAGEIRAVERDRLAAEPSHLAALVEFAGRAYRRPLSAAEREGLLAFYHTLRRKDKRDHEEALRDTLATVLLSPHFCFRLDPVDNRGSGPATEPLSDYALASRLSYFLWSSMPDAELLAQAAAGNLHNPEALAAQARRLLRDPRVRGLATEFGGNWLDFRRFEEHNAVDRGRFPSFTPELRQAMFEEPIRFFLDAAQRNRSVLDLLHAGDTFVNRPLAKHYGMPLAAKGADPWVHVEDARRYGRGGLLPMAVFLTRNAPGLRTSPVKRGYWVVRRLLGEQIPPPPPTVPELPKDEAKLGALTLPQLLARHREDRACAGCHRRFDSIGLAFEGFGPVGERRTKDLAGHPVQTLATFPDEKDREGLEGLRAYLRDRRQDDFVKNLCKKLFSYALGRSLLLSDRKALDAMQARLAADRYALGSLVEAIVTSPQFRNRRVGDSQTVE